MTKLTELKIGDYYVRIHQEDPRYKTLIVENDLEKTGYAIEHDGTFRPVCICHSRENSECVCGYGNYETND